MGLMRTAACVVLFCAMSTAVQAQEEMFSEGQSDPVPVVDAFAELQAWNRAWAAFEADAALFEAQGYVVSYWENDMWYGPVSGGQQVVFCHVIWHYW